MLGTRSKALMETMGRFHSLGTLTHCIETGAQLERLKFFEKYLRVFNNLDILGYFPPRD
jgi:hypothetical protein